MTDSSIHAARADCRTLARRRAERRVSGRTIRAPANRCPTVFPVSTWADCDEALERGRRRRPRRCASCRASGWRNSWRCFAQRIERRADELVACAHAETGLPAAPRLRDVELPRTTHQLRQAAQAARDGSWRLATIDTAANIRCWLAPLGPVVVFGPNNFPFAFGSVSGGDFAAAIAAGNPVIAKANSSHPGHDAAVCGRGSGSRRADGAARRHGPADLSASRTQDGERLVADPRVGATGYTGSRAAGLALKAAADRAGKPIYLELSSVNPVVILPGALATRADQIVEEFTTSCLMGTGQFCTNPGLVVLMRRAARARRSWRPLAAAFRGGSGRDLALAAACRSRSQESIRQLMRPGPSG